MQIDDATVSGLLIAVDQVSPAKFSRLTPTVADADSNQMLDIYPYNSRSRWDDRVAEPRSLRVPTMA